MTPLRRFLAFVESRELIRLRKEAGMKKPWTTDAILLSYRFCNIRREDDTVTRWLAHHWRTPHESDPHLWFAMTIARIINWPDTLVEIGYPLNGWTKHYEKHFLEVCAARKASGQKVWSGAYMIRSGGGEPGGKPGYYARTSFAPMWADRNRLMPTAKDTLGYFHNRIMGCFGMGSFLAAQIVADTKYVLPLLGAKDWWVWAAPGPGSQRGLSRVVDLPLKTTWKSLDWELQLGVVKDELNAHLMKQNWEPLHAQDVQNCLCEFDKYERVRLGEGRPRALYPGKGEE
jgi:hypothetical protein